MENDIRIHLDEISPEDTARHEAANGYISRSWLCRMARPSWTQHGPPTSRERKGGEPQKDSDRTP